MASHVFRYLSEQEVIDMKRTRGNYAGGQRIFALQMTWGPLDEADDTSHSSTAIQPIGTAIRAEDSAHPLSWEDLSGTKSSTDLSSVSSPQVANSCAIVSSASGNPACSGSTVAATVYSSADENTESVRLQSASAFSDIIGTFPFEMGHSLWETTLSLEHLLGYLPDELRAWALYDIFVNEASWYDTPIMADELHEVLVQVYDPMANIYELPPHSLAVIFGVFAHAALADRSLPAYNNVEADTYFDLGRTALTLQPVFGSTDLRTIQALVLTGIYQATGGPRYSADSAWISLACRLCYSLRLHVEEAHMEFDNTTAQRRRTIFWEIYSLETYQALALARPPNITLADITCEFPADFEETVGSGGHIIPGFFRLKWKFTKEIIAPMTQLYARATPPTQEEVLALDRRLRRFMSTAPLEHYEGSTFLAYLRTHMMPRFGGDMMLSMHIGFFVQALTDNPHNPLESPHATSFLATYRGASDVIQTDLRGFSLYPAYFHRWWRIWKSLINAAFIVGSIVIKCPTSDIAPTAFMQLLAAVDLVERGPAHSFLTESSLPVLQRLRNKATVVYIELHQPRIEWPLLLNQLGTLPVASISELWQPQSPDLTFVFDFPTQEGPFSPASTPLESLEAYLATQM
ncbi:fungal-specific transcription factor domain-containing protein [Mycena vulgaris]|nr:fungal-specific transcription factor domain-containing protein [Mycena vulgaris]